MRLFSAYKIFFLWAAIAVFCSAAIFPEPKSPNPKAADVLRKKMQKYGTPGMVATLIQNGKIAETLSAGYADRENKKSMISETLIPAASLTKLVTAVLVMRQVERNRLDLDKPVNTYLAPTYRIKDNSGKDSPATLRQLLSHSSGLPVSWKPIASRGDRVLSLDAYLAGGLKTAYPPGERIIYANDGFSLAGFVAAKAEGEGFAEHAERVLLRPLKMKTSTFESPWSLKSENLARAYGGLMGGGGLTEHSDVTAALPAGGLISSAPELARFALMLLNGGEIDGVRILSKTSVAEIFSFQAKPHPDAKMGFGLGFGIYEDKGNKIVWWDGGLAGVADRLILHPASGSGVVLFSNQSENAASSEAANALLALLVTPPVQPSYQPDAKELEKFAGTYRFYNSVDPAKWYLRYGIDLTLRAENGILRYESRILKKGALTPLGPGRFRLTESMLAGSDVFFSGDSIYLGYLRAERVPFYAMLPAAVVYALLLVCALLYLVYRLIRFIFASRAQRPE